MATSFSGGRTRSTRMEPPTMGKQLVNFITCGCESSASFIAKSEHCENICLGKNDNHAKKAFLSLETRLNRTFKRGYMSLQMLFGNVFQKEISVIGLLSRNCFPVERNLKRFPIEGFFHFSRINTTRQTTV